MYTQRRERGYVGILTLILASVLDYWWGKTSLHYMVNWRSISELFLKTFFDNQQCCATAHCELPNFHDCCCDWRRAERLRVRCVAP